MTKAAARLTNRGRWRRTPTAASVTLTVRTMLVVLSVAGCVPRQASPPAVPPPPFLIGTFTDDYGVRYEISSAQWLQLPRARYHIARWNVQGQYLIARNDSANAQDAGLWTRVDWVELSGMPPWRWGFCYSAFRAPTAAAAETVSVARRDTPRTGCNGFPFSRMQPAR